jgi:transcriptional regulator GlxA family with amidase domain
MDSLGSPAQNRRMSVQPSSAQPAKVIDLRIARVLRAVQAEPQRRFSVRELAKLAGASRASFVRLFQAATGSSPQRWLTERRLERAKALLAQGSSTLARVAAEVGYRSEFSFSRAFKRRYGQSPQHFRQGQAPIRCAA